MKFHRVSNGFHLEINYIVYKRQLLREKVGYKRARNSLTLQLQRNSRGIRMNDCYKLSMKLGANGSAMSSCKLKCPPPRSEHLWSGRAINYLYWASVPVSVVLVDRPYHCQSISNATAVGLRQTSRRNQPIYCGTMGQHDSIVSRRLCINWPSPLFFASTSIHTLFQERFLDSFFVFLPRPKTVNISCYGCPQDSSIKWKWSCARRFR